MAIRPDYVPVLKGKEGEYGALEELSADVRRRLMPLIEIPDIPYDYANESPAKSLDQHVVGIAERLQRCWGGCPSISTCPGLKKMSTYPMGELRSRQCSQIAHAGTSNRSSRVSC
jgi:hypothetical protein